MGSLTPQLNILPEGQLLVWEQLSATPKDFVLYGGTALALRLGHRQSVDFDFFSSRPFQPAELIRAIPYLHDQAITQQEPNTLSCDIDTGKGLVKASFFGGLSRGTIKKPDRVESNGISVASLHDIFGMKCVTIPQRNEVKDYLDIHALIVKGKLDLSTGIACAIAIYGRQYNPLLTLQALCYFEDLPDSFAENVKSDLIAAVKSVSLQDLPAMTASGRIGVETGKEKP